MKNKKAKSDEIVFNVTPKRKPAPGEYHIGATLRGLFFYLLITAPVAVFGYILYNSEGFKIYKQYDIWNHMSVPNANNIFILFWVGIGCMIATVLLLALFSIITRFVKNKKVQSGYASSVVLIGAVGVLLTALSQYYFAKVYEFISYETTTQTDPQNIQDWASAISDKLNKTANVTSLEWIPSSVVWWVMFVQLMFVFSVEVTLQNALNTDYGLNDYEKYMSDSKQEDSKLDLSKLNRFFKNTFKNSDKSIAKFLIIAAVVVVIPNFVYSIIGTVPSTRMQATIDWGYKIPTLIQDIKTSGDPQIAPVLAEMKKAKYGEEFVISSLPIIMEGLTIATVFLFIAMLLRGKNVSNRIFLIETAVLFVEVLALISVSLASKIYLWRMSNYLGDHITAFSDAVGTISGGKDKFLYDFPTNEISSTAKIEWLDPAATIAEGIIAYAWALGCFGLIGNGIYRLGYFKKDTKITYESGILNR